ncbi:hypothetical protein SFRURICE_016677 [Spodoptera frugiperda]|nr:hypothetical protein SFRURICE_016677 [Spodoptera frugiperda]
MLTGAVFSTSRTGSKLIKIGGYSFCRHRSSGVKTRWNCSTGNFKGCKAAIYTIDNMIVKINNDHNHDPKKCCAVFFTSKRGSDLISNIFSVPYITQSKRGAYILMAAGYKFYRHCEIGTKTRWYCATNYHKGCKASAYTENFIVTKIKNIHNHGDESIAVYWARYQTEEFSKIRKKLNVSYSYTQRGSKVVVLDGFRYTKHTTQGLRIRWRCSHHFSQNCTASIYTYEDKIYRANVKHTHQPIPPQNSFY